jgi:hypothetical protein
MWFSFLKTGETAGLLSVCEHNQRDIVGLASIFIVLTHIAHDPVHALKTYTYDFERLALRWRETLKRKQAVLGPDTVQKGVQVLEVAAKQAYPHVVFALSLDLMHQGHHEKARTQLLKLIQGVCPGTTRILALRALAIDAEWRLQDKDKALTYVEQALSQEEISEHVKKDLCYRRERLVQKVKIE